MPYRFFRLGKSVPQITRNLAGSVSVVDGSITAAKLASDAVTTAKILDDNVTTAKILDDNVTAAKLSNGLIQKIADYIVYKDGASYKHVNSSTGVMTSNASFSTLLQAIIANNKKIHIVTGSYALADKIYFDGIANCSITSDGAVIELSNSFAGSYEADYAGIFIKDSTDIHIAGFEFNQNFSNQPSNEVHGIKIYGTSDKIFIDNINFKESTKGDIWLTGSTGRVSITNCRFYDYGGYATAPFSIYTSGHEELIVHNCDWNTAHANGHSLYINGGVSSKTFISQCTFKTIKYALTTRNGYTVFRDSTGDECQVVCLQSINDSTVILENLKFTEVYGDTPNAISSAVWIATGRAIIKNCYLVGKSSTLNYRAITLRYQEANKEVRDCIVEGNYTENWSQDGMGIYINDTLGRHVIRNNIIKGSGAGANDAILSTNANANESVAYDNIFLDGNTGKVYDNNDSKLIIKGSLGYKAENWGNASKADGDTIAHGLATTPTYINVKSAIQGHIVTVQAKDATNITIDLVDDAGTQITVNETIYWEARV